MDDSNEIAKCLITGHPDFSLPEQPHLHYGSMRELVQANANRFRFAYKNTSNAVSDAARKKIATEMLETGNLVCWSLTI